MNEDGNSSEDYPHSGIVINQYLKLNTKYKGSPARQ